jgi:hypothetical protein
MRKVSVFVLVGVLAALVLVASPALAQKGKKKTGRAYWHGTLVRASSDGSAFTVRKGNIERVIHLTADTRYTRAEGKTSVDIEKGDIKDGDELVCLGKYDENGEFVATRVDKRPAK